MSRLELFAKELNKKVGEDIAQYGIAKQEYDKLVFTSPRLNYMTFGGLPVGRMYEFAGPEGSGKTTTAIDLMVNAQKKFAKEAEETGNPEKQIVFLDEEGTFDRVWASKFGLDVEKVFFISPKTMCAEEVLTVLRDAINTGEVGLAVLDSVATLVPKQLMGEDMEKKAYGGIAIALTRFCNEVIGMLLKYDCTLIMINQVRDDLNSMFGGTITPGGRAFKHACSGRFEFRKGKFIDDNNKELTNAAENPAGNIIHVVIKKTKVFEPTRRVGYYSVKYVTGPDFMNDYIDVGIQLGIINQRGSYFDIIDINTGEILNTEKIQGKPTLKAELEAHPGWVEMINNVMNGKAIEEVTDAEALAQANEIANEIVKNSKDE